jgi:hypothetical protein
MLLELLEVISREILSEFPPFCCRCFKVVPEVCRGDFMVFNGEEGLHILFIAVVCSPIRCSFSFKAIGAPSDFGLKTTGIIPARLSLDESNTATFRLLFGSFELLGECHILEEGSERDVKEALDIMLMYFSCGSAIRSEMDAA